MTTWLSALTHLDSLLARVQNVLDTLARVELKLDAIAHELGTLDDMEDEEAEDDEE